MNWNTFKKTLGEKVHVGFNRAFFLMGFESGSEQQAYILAPGIAKGLVEGLSKKIAEYEAKFGPIDMKGVESGIESPVQIP